MDNDPENEDNYSKAPKKSSFWQVMFVSIKSEKGKRIIKNHFIPIILFLLLSLIIFRNLIGAEGEIIHGDYTRPPDLEKLFRFYYPMWSEDWSTSTIVRLPQFLFILPFFAIGVIFNLNTTELFVMIFIFIGFLSGVSMFYASKYLLYRTYNSEDGKIVIASFMAGLAYMWSNFMIIYTFLPFIRVAFALAPLIFLYLVKGLETRKLKYILLSAFLWSVACGDTHWVIYGAILLTAFIIFNFFVDYIRLSHKGKLKALKKSLFFHSYNFTFLIGGFVCFSCYWFIPGLLMGGTSRYSAILTEESLERYYSGSGLIEIMGRQSTYFRSPIFYDPVIDVFSSQIMQNLLILLGFTLFIFGMMALVLRPRNRYVVFFSIFTLISIFLATMINFAPDIGFWIINEAPLHELYGWSFKTPIISQFVILSLSFLLAFSVFEILTRLEKNRYRNLPLKKGSAVVVMSILLLSIVLPNWPLLTGDMNGYISPVVMPDEFSQVNSWLEEQEGDFKVLWLPNYQSNEVDWNKGHRISKDIAGLSSSKPTYVFWTPQIQPNGYGIYFLYSSVYHLHPDSMLLSNATNSFGKLLAPLGIRYIVFHDDNATNEENKNSLFNNLLHQDDIELIEQFGFIYVFQNNYLAGAGTNHFFTTSRDFLVSGGLSSLATFNSIPQYESRENGLLYAQQKLYDTDELERVIDDVVFTSSAGPEEIAFTFVDDRFLLAPFDSTDHYAPHEVWSKVTVSSLGNIRAHVRGDMEEWDWDYNRGMVFTYSTGTLEDNITLMDGDLIEEFDFESGLEGFYKFDSDINLSLSGNSASGELGLTGVIPRGESDDELVVSSGKITIPNGTNRYRAMMYISADNASNFQVQFRYYDSNDNYLGRHYLITESGSFGYMNLVRDLSFPAKTDYFTIQVQGDRNAISDFQWWVDGIRVYDLRSNTVPNILEMDFNAAKNGDFDIYLRCLKSESGGAIDVHLDGEIIGTVKTIGRTNALIWENVASLRLEEGRHRIGINNIGGFNAVNLVAVIPEEKTQEYIAQAEVFLENRGLIYVLEAESDFDYYNGEINYDRGGSAGWGKSLLLNDGGFLRLPVQIFREGNYSISLKFIPGSENNVINVQFGDYSYHRSGNSEDGFIWINLTNIPLETGIHELNISASSEETIAYNQSFEIWNPQENAPQGWNSPRPQFTPSLNSTVSTSGNYSLMFTTNATELVFGDWMQGDELILEPGQRYRVQIDIKTQNALGTYVRIQGYNEEDMRWETLANIKPADEGTSDWDEYSGSFNLPGNMSRIRPIIYPGRILNPLSGNCTTWFDDFGILSMGLESEIDIVVIYSKDDDREIGNLFGSRNVARILSHKKIDSTKYELRISSSDPFMLGFAEAYDEFWFAHVDGAGEIESVPLYGMINGFYIEKTGNFTVTIEFRPQQWFNLGMGITGSSIILTLGYYIWIDRRKWGEKFNTMGHKMRRLSDQIMRRKVENESN